MLKKLIDAEWVAEDEKLKVKKMNLKKKRTVWYHAQQNHKNVWITAEDPSTQEISLAQIDLKISKMLTNFSGTLIFHLIQS